MSIHSFRIKAKEFLFFNKVVQVFEMQHLIWVQSSRKDAAYCGSNLLHVHMKNQEGNGFLSLSLKSCGTYTQWSIIQPLKRIHLNQF